MKTEAQKQAQARYERQNTIQYKIKLVKTTDGDIIEHLKAQPNRQGYIKDLIRRDMQK